MDKLKYTHIFELLPGELHLMIADYLKLGDLLNLSLSCNLWYRSTPPILAQRLAKLPLFLVIAILYYKDIFKKTHSEVLSRFEVGRIRTPILHSSQKLDIVTYYDKSESKRETLRYTMRDDKEKFKRIEMSITQIDHDTHGSVPTPLLLDILREESKVVVTKGYTQSCYPYVPQLIMIGQDCYPVRPISKRFVTAPDKYIIKPMKAILPTLLWRGINELDSTERGKERDLMERDEEFERYRSKFYLIHNPEFDYATSD